MARMLVLAILAISSFASAADTATVYIYRFHAKSTWGSAFTDGAQNSVKYPVAVNDAQVGILKAQHYIAIELPSGPYSFGLRHYKAESATLDLQPGQSYFLRIDEDINWIPGKSRLSLTVVSESQAMPELKQIKHQTDHVDVPLWLTAAH